MGDTNVTCTFDPWPGYSVRGNHQEDGFSFQHPYLWWESNATPGDPTGGMLRRQADGGTMYITTTNGTPFTPVDFFLAEWDSNPTPGTLTLIGTRADGSTVTASYGMKRVCPKCDVPLFILHFRDLDVDFCHQCRGLWLDAGEVGSIPIARSTFTEQNAKLCFCRDKAVTNSVVWGAR
jgi:hypothetical protein